MEVTATEFKTNFGKYLERARVEDIRITKNGKSVAKLVGTEVSSVDAISGILNTAASEEIDRRSIREERLAEYEMHD